MSSAIFIFILIMAMFIVIGILIKYFKCYFLISGYNTASIDKKAKVDILGLSKLMGNFCFVMAGIFLISWLFNYYGSFVGFFSTLSTIFIAIPYVLFKAQKFDLNTKKSKGKVKTRVTVLIVVISILIPVILFGAIINSSKEPEVSINSGSIDIKGIYSTKININEISDILLKDKIPEVIGKSNGFDFGTILKGNFELEGLGISKIYVHYDKPPFIYIRIGKKYVILNFKNSQKTKDLYNKILIELK